MKNKLVGNENLGALWHMMFGVLYTGAAFFHMLSVVTHLQRAKRLKKEAWDGCPCTMPESTELRREVQENERPRSL